ncbi:MAG: OsmC family protein [Anaerolineae bacterium]|nr:OsmC family protein [Anaerolineae bacterium]
MAKLKRKAEAVWKGDLRGGKGRISSESGAVKDMAYSFSTRFENEPGTNPEELIAAAHAACYSMAFANTLAQKGYEPESIETHATCTLASQEGGGFKIAKMHLQVRGRVPGIDQERFAQIAEQADGECPVSNLLREGLKIEREVTLM